MTLFPPPVSQKHRPDHQLAPKSLHQTLPSGDPRPRGASGTLWNRRPLRRGNGGPTRGKAAHRTPGGWGRSWGQGPSVYAQDLGTPALQSPGRQLRDALHHQTLTEGCVTGARPGSVPRSATDTDGPCRPGAPSRMGRQTGPRRTENGSAGVLSKESAWGAIGAPGTVARTGPQGGLLEELL